jgi:hypothetical protein
MKVVIALSILALTTAGYLPHRRLGDNNDILPLNEFLAFVSTEQTKEPSSKGSSRKLPSDSSKNASNKKDCDPSNALKWKDAFKAPTGGGSKPLKNKSSKSKGSSSKASNGSSKSSGSSKSGSSSKGSKGHMPTTAPSSVPSDIPSDMPSSMPSTTQSFVTACHCDGTTCLSHSLQADDLLHICIFAEPGYFFHTVDSLVLIQGSFEQVILMPGQGNSTGMLRDCIGSSVCVIEAEVLPIFFSHDVPIIAGGVALMTRNTMLRSNHLYEMDYQTAVPLSGDMVLDIGSGSMMTDNGEGDDDGRSVVLSWALPLVLVLVFCVLALIFIWRRRSVRDDE